MSARIATYAPAGTRCGIADYARTLLRALSPNYPVELVPAERAMGDGGYLDAARRLNEYALVHAHYEHGFYLHGDRLHENTAQFFSAIDAPLIVTFHCLPDFQNPVWDKVLARESCRAMVHSQAYRDRLLDCMPAERVSLHYIPAFELSADPPSDEFSRQCASVEDRRLLAMFGFIKRHKNFEAVLSALRDLPDDVVLVCVGGPQNDLDRAYMDEFRSTVNAMGLAQRVIVTGYVAESDAHAWLKRCDILVAPYTWVSGSASIATGLGCGCVVLASDLPANVDLALRYGCLKLYERDDPDALPAAIDALLHDPEARADLRDGALDYRTHNNANTLAQLVGGLYRRMGVLPPQ